MKSDRSRSSSPATAPIRVRPREPPPGVEVRYVPEVHPDDIAVVDGIPVTSVSRTLSDLAERLSEAELRECFKTARVRGFLDLEQLAASRRRVDWRPSLAKFDRVLAHCS